MSVKTLRYIPLPNVSSTTSPANVIQTQLMDAKRLRTFTEKIQSNEITHLDLRNIPLHISTIHFQEFIKALEGSDESTNNKASQQEEHHSRIDENDDGEGNDDDIPVNRNRNNNDKEEETISDCRSYMNGNQSIVNVNIILRFLQKLTLKEQEQIFASVGRLSNLEHVRVASSGLAGTALRLINISLREIIQTNEYFNNKLKLLEQQQHQRQQIQQFQYQTNDKQQKEDEKQQETATAPTTRQQAPSSGSGKFPSFKSLTLHSIHFKNKVYFKPSGGGGGNGDDYDEDDDDGTTIRSSRFKNDPEIVEFRSLLIKLLPYLESFTLEDIEETFDIDSLIPILFMSSSPSPSSSKPYSSLTSSLYESLPNDKDGRLQAINDSTNDTEPARMNTETMTTTEEAATPKEATVDSEHVNNCTNHTKLKYLYVRSHNFPSEPRLTKDSLVALFRDRHNSPPPPPSSTSDGDGNLYQSCSDLESLTLSRLDLGPVLSDSILMDHLKDNRTLQSLTLEQNLIGSDVAMDFAFLLQTNSISLRELNLGYNLITDDGAASMFNALASPIPSTPSYPSVRQLQSLDLRANGLGMESCRAIANLLSTNACPSLSFLGLAQNRLLDNGCLLIASALHTNCTLTSLVLSETGIRDSDTCAMLASAIIANSTVRATATTTSTTNTKEESDEQRNGRQQLQLRQEHRYLKLERLDLAGNRINDDGCIALAKALRKPTNDEYDDDDENKAFSRRNYYRPPALKSLNLSRNQIRDSGVIALANALAPGKHDNGNNNILNHENNSDLGLGGGLSSSSSVSLEQLNLANNHMMKNPSYDALEHMLETNMTLQHLWLPTIPSKQYDTIPTYIKLNKLGRRHLLRRIDDVNLWVDALTSCIDDIHCLYYLIRANPNAVSWMTSTK